MPGAFLGTGLALVLDFAGVKVGFSLASGEGEGRGPLNNASSSSPSMVSWVISCSAIWTNFGLFSVRIFLAVS